MKPKQSQATQGYLPAMPPLPLVPGEGEERFVLMVLSRVNKHPLHRACRFQAHRRAQHVKQVSVHVRRLLSCLRRFRCRSGRFGRVGDGGSGCGPP